MSPLPSPVVGAARTASDPEAGKAPVLALRDRDTALRRGSVTSLSSHSEKRRAVESRGPESARTVVGEGPPSPGSVGGPVRSRNDPDAASIVTIVGPPTLADLPTELLKAILEFVASGPARSGGRDTQPAADDDWTMDFDDANDFLDPAHHIGGLSVADAGPELSVPPAYRAFWTYPQSLPGGSESGASQAFGSAAMASPDHAGLFELPSSHSASLAHCMRLSKGFFFLALPLLYQNPRLSTHASLKAFSRSLGSKQRGQIYGSAVRTLSVGVSPDEVSGILLEGIVAKCPNILSVHIFGRLDERSRGAVGDVGSTRSAAIRHLGSNQPFGEVHVDNNGRAPPRGASSTRSGIPLSVTAFSAAAVSRPPVSPAEHHAIALTNAYMANVQRALEEMRRAAATSRANAGAAVLGSVTPARPPIPELAAYGNSHDYFAEASAAARRSAGVVVNLDDRGRDAQRGRRSRRGTGGSGGQGDTQMAAPFTSTPYFVAASAAALGAPARPSLDGAPNAVSSFSGRILPRTGTSHAFPAQTPFESMTTSYFEAATAAAAAPKTAAQMPVVIAPKPVRPALPQQTQTAPKKSIFRSNSQTRSGSRALSPSGSSSATRPVSPQHLSFFHFPRALSPPSSKTVPPRQQGSHYHHVRLGSPPPAVVPEPTASFESVWSRSMLENPELYPSRVPHPLLKSVSVAMLPPLLAQDRFRKLRFEHLTFPRGASLLVRFSNGDRGVRELEFRGCLLDSRVLWRALANSGRSLEAFTVASCRVFEADEREFDNRAFAFWEPLIGGMVPRGGGKTLLKRLDVSDPLSGLLKPDDRSLMHILRLMGRSLEYLAMDVSNCTRHGLVRAARWCAANLKWGGEGGTRIRGLEWVYQGSPRKEGAKRDTPEKDAEKDKEPIHASSPPRAMFGPLGAVDGDNVRSGDALGQLAKILEEFDISEEDSVVIDGFEEVQFWAYFASLVGAIGWTVRAVGDKVPCH